MRSRRRLTIALLLSLALHGLALLAILLLVRKPAAGPAKPAPLRIVLVPFEPASKKPVTKPAAPAQLHGLAQAPGAKPAAPNPKAVASAPRPERTPKPGTPSAPEHASAPPAVASAPPSAVTSPDSPRSLHLLPNPTPFLAQGPTEPEESHGHTIHNTPEELPDPRAVAEVQAQEAKRKLDGWISDELASARAQNGLVDAWFGQMRGALQKETERLPVEQKGPLLLQMTQAWLSAGQNYGKSGNPYAPGMGPEAHPKGGIQTPQEQTAERFRGTPAEAFQKQMDMAARLREFGDGRFGGVFKAVVEIRQDPRGKLLSTLLVESSGNKQFDGFVMQRAPIAVGTVPPPPEKGAGLHPDGIRSTWEFEGRITYKKQMKDTKLLEDGWYMAAMAPLGLLTGNFDEVTGSADFVDLRNPEFACRVHLLKVY